MYSYYFSCHLKPSSTLLFLPGIKVTMFSKGCLIRQSAVVAGPCGCCQACLHHCLCWWDLSCLFWYSSNMFLFLSRYAPSLPRKKNKIFTEGEEERHWGRNLQCFQEGFFRGRQYITHLVFLYLLCFEGASTPLFMWTLIHTVTPAVWLYSTSTKCYCINTSCSKISGKTVVLEVITLLCVSVCLCEWVRLCVRCIHTQVYSCIGACFPLCLFIFTHTVTVYIVFSSLYSNLTLNKADVPLKPESIVLCFSPSPVTTGN